MRPWVCLVALLAWLVGPIPAHSQTPAYPNRPISLIVGLAAGGAVDIIARLYAEKLSQLIGQRVIVENRGGGGGIPAALATKGAEPDGYTLMVLLGALHTISLSLQPLPFDPIADFTPITPLYSAPGYVVVPASREARSMKELIAYGRSKADGLIYPSPSSGSPAHLMGLLFQEVTGVKVTHVPYRGGGQLMNDLLAGQFDIAFPTYTNFKSSLDPGRLRVLAIAAAKRSSQLPDVPTLTEAGYAGIDVENVFGVVGPLGLQKDTVAFLNDAFRRVATDPVLIARLNDLGVVSIANTPEALVEFIQNDTKRFAAIIKKYGISQ